MTKRIGPFRWVAIAAVLLAACGAPADDRSEESASTEAAAPVADPPTASAMLALERQANEAYFAGDAAFFESLLNDPFVMLGPGGARMDRAATIGMIGGVRCDVEDGWALDEPRLSAVDADTYVLTYRGTFVGTCTADGETAEMPSPVRAATVWVRSGGEWRPAFHGENPIFDPRTTAAPPAEPTTSDANDEALGAGPASPTADPTTDALVAIETSVWEAWAVRDTATLEERTAGELAFVDIFGNVTSGRTETLAFWTGHTCDVESVRVADGTATPLSENVSILTFKGILEGTCGGQRFPLIHGTSLYVREGDDWKLAFTLNDLSS